MVSEHFHPWTPQQGQSAFAWSFMGALGHARRSLHVRDRRDVPGLPLPPRGHRPRGGDAGRHVPGPLLAGAGCRRGAQRARHRRRVAGDRHPLGDDVRVHRDHQQAVHAARSSSTRASTSRSRAPSSTRARTSAGPDLRRDGRPDQRQEDRQVRGRDDHRRRRGREDRDAVGASSTRAPARPARTRRVRRSCSRSTSRWARDRRGGRSTTR